MKKTSFKDLTTFKVGGEIEHYIKVKNKTELKKAVSFAKEKHLPIFVIGEGSDILVSDKKFKGVVISYTKKDVTIKDNIVEADGGMVWDDLVNLCVSKNLQGIECLSLIPGTVGAAPIQNIGAYGQELSDTFVKLKAYDTQKEKFVEFNKKECHFGYRDSVFKNPENWQRYIIIKVYLKLKENGKPNITYQSLKKVLPQNPRLSQVRNVVIKIRTEKLEDWKKVPNAGSFFKNPIVSKEKREEILKKYPDLVSHQDNGNYKISAGWLIEKCGLKRKNFRNCQISKKHALVLTNSNSKASFKQIVGFSKVIKNKVQEKFGIALEAEVQTIAFLEKVAILGHGIEGEDARKFFETQGIDVDLLDQKYNKNYLSNLTKYDLVVRSPGVYRYKKEIVEAEKAGVEISSAIKIFFTLCKGKIIGVTGTKGKGTTATLIYEILKKAGKDVHLAGNIGAPYLELLAKIKKDTFVILEMSSFQLIDTDKSPHIAVVLNITSDHMDWHKDQEEYIEAKKNIVRHQEKTDWAVVNSDYKTSKVFIKETIAKRILFSKNKLEKQYKEERILKGEHNLENIAAAVEVAKILKINTKTIAEVVKKFKGLEHRLEFVKEVNEISFYNDSFATGPQPTIAAINSFEQPQTLILGGSDKKMDYSVLAKEIVKKKNVKNIIVIGQIRKQIIKELKKAEYKNNLIDLKSAKMKEIVKKAKEITPKNGVVILSPAAASFDMFENYKDRGRQFKEEVKAL